MTRRTSSLLLLAGLAQLILVGALLALPATPALAAPLAALTQTAEPPTQTPEPPTATPLPPTATATVPPTATAEPPPPEEEPRDRRADPAVTKRANVAETKVGDLVTFTLTVTNQGDGVARGVIVEDALPGFLALVSADATKGQVVVNGTVVGVWIGDVEPGEVITITIVARVTSPAAPPNNRNTAVLTTTSGSNDPTNDEASAPLNVPSLLPTATATPVVTATPEPAASPTPTATAPAAGGAVAAPPAAPDQPRPATLPVTSGPVGGPTLLLLAAVAQTVLGLLLRLRGRPRNGRVDG